MSFGLGYFEDGVWVDHSNGDDPRATGSGDVALDAVHAWYGCCSEPTVAETPVIAALGIADEVDRPAPVLALPTAGTRASSR
jgi:hypothetical protein